MNSRLNQNHPKISLNVEMNSFFSPHTHTQFLCVCFCLSGAILREWMLSLSFEMCICECVHLNYIMYKSHIADSGIFSAFWFVHWLDPSCCFVVPFGFDKCGFYTATTSQTTDSFSICAPWWIFGRSFVWGKMNLNSGWLPKVIYIHTIRSIAFFSCACLNEFVLPPSYFLYNSVVYTSFNHAHFSVLLHIGLYLCVCMCELLSGFSQTANGVWMVLLLFFLFCRCTDFKHWKYNNVTLFTPHILCGFLNDLCPFLRGEMCAGIHHCRWRAGT